MWLMRETVRKSLCLRSYVLVFFGGIDIAKEAVVEPDVSNSGFTAFLGK